MIATRGRGYVSRPRQRCTSDGASRGLHMPSIVEVPGNDGDELKREVNGEGKRTEVGRRAKADGSKWWAEILSRLRSSSNARSLARSDLVSPNIFISLALYPIDGIVEIEHDGPRQRYPRGACPSRHTCRKHQNVWKTIFGLDFAAAASIMSSDRC